MSSIVHAGLFLLLLIFDIRAQDGCLACHSETRPVHQTRTGVLSIWAKSPYPSEYPGHIWLSQSDLLSLSQGSTGSATSWFQSLSDLIARPVTDAKDMASKVREMYKLLEQGAEEVPAYALLWQEWKRSLVNLADPIARLFQTNENAVQFHDDRFLPTAKDYLRKVSQPFLMLDPPRDISLTYQADSHMQASKVWPVFAGLNQKSKSNITYTFASGNSLTGSLSIARLNHDGAIIGNEAGSFSLSEMGAVLKLDSGGVQPGPNLKNMAALFDRGIGADLRDLRGEKLIYTGRVKGSRRDRLRLVMTLTPQRIYQQNQEVILELAMELKEHAEDRGDALQLSGSGLVSVTRDGLLYQLDSSVQFRVKMAGLSLIKGGSRDTIQRVMN